MPIRTTIARLVVVLACAAAGDASATEYFASPTGSDSNPGTLASPFRTVQRGVDALGTGDTLTLRGGLYASADTVLMTVSGTSGAPITIRAYPGETPVLRRTSADSTLLTGAAHLAFEDLVFDGGLLAEEGIKVHIIDGQRSHHVRVSRCTFRNHRGSGILAAPGDDLLVEDSVFVGNGLTSHDHGIYMNNGDRAVIRNSVFEGNAGFGIHFFCDVYDEVLSASGLYGGMGGLVTGNRSHGNGFKESNGSGIVVSGDWRGVVVENNVAWGNYNEGIVLDYSSFAPQGTLIRNNTFYGNGATSAAPQIAVGFAQDTVVSNNIADPGDGQGGTAGITSAATGTVFDRNLYPYPDRFAIDGNDVGLATWQSATGETNALMAVSGLVSPSTGDFHLSAASPAIDAGSSAPGHFAATDFEGDPRPSGAGVDIGADEAAPFVPPPPQSNLFFDDFEDGDASDWTHSRGGWVVVGGSLTGTVLRWVADDIAPFGGCSRCTIKADMRVQTPGGAVSLLGWYQDGGNHVELMMNDRRDRLVLRQWAGGWIVAQRVALVRIRSGVSYRVRLAYDGNALQAALDGVPMLQMVPVSPPAGTVGFRVRSTLSPTTGSLQQIQVDFAPRTE